MDKIELTTPTLSTDDDKIKAEGLALYAELSGKEIPGGTPKVDTPKDDTGLIFGKYKSIDEAEKAYKSLQAEYTKLSQNKPEADVSATPETPQAVEDAGFGKYYEALSRDGKLSDDMYAELESKGFDRAIVDKYISQVGVQNTQNQQAPVNSQPTVGGNEDALVSAAYSAAGGQEAFSNIQAWARQNLNEMEIAGFDAIVASGNPDSVKTAVANLKARYTESKLANFDPSRAVGNAPIDTTPSVQAYKSIDEFLADLGDSDSYDLHKQSVIKDKLKKSPMFKGLTETKNGAKLTF